MKWLQYAPIKRKLYLIIMVTVAAVLLLNLVASLAVQIGAARNASETRLQALAMVLGANSRAVLLFRDRDAAREVLDTLATQDDVLWAIVGDLSQLRGTLAWQALVVLGVFAVSMLLALLLSRQLQRVVSIPVYRLLNAMGGVAATRDFGRRVEPISNDELGDLTTLTPKALDKGIDLTTFCSREMPSVLHGDSSRLRQILTNLVDNAVKFTSQGTVAIRIERVDRKNDATAGTVSIRILVRDTGIGIPLNSRYYFFSPSSRVTDRSHGFSAAQASDW